MGNFQKKGNLIKDWDKHWVGKEEANMPRGSKEWINLCWQMGFEYWEQVFEKFSPGKEMLECGAGTAKVSVHMAKKGYNCTMLDNSETGLNYGKIEFAGAGLEGKFVLGDVMKLPFKDGTFDIVFSGGLLEHFEDVRPVIKEMVRVLRPGGVFSADIIPKSRWFSTQGLADRLAFCGSIFLRIVKLQLKDAVKNSRQPFPFYESPMSCGGYRKIIKEAGLKNVVATGTSIFPSLPCERLRKIYIKPVKRALPLWRAFNRSNSKITEIFGNVYSIYGIKK